MAENEVKFVVRDYTQLEALMTPLGWCDIDQGYLNPNNRVRRITYPSGGQLYYFTYKQRLPNGQNLELEPEIKPEQFCEAWEYTNERLRKRRVSVQHGRLKWDVDFYRWSYPYFVLAEVEMPEHMQRPDAILPCLEGRIVHEAERDDGRFAARRLADEAHVRTVAKELGLYHE